MFEKQAVIRSHIVEMNHEQVADLGKCQKRQIAL